MAGRTGGARWRFGAKVLRWRAPGNSGPSPVRRPRARFAAAHSGCVGAPPGDTTVPCQELADGGGHTWRRRPKARPGAAVKTPRWSAGRRAGPVMAGHLRPNFRRWTRSRDGSPGASVNRASAVQRSIPLTFLGTTDPRRSPRAGSSGRRSVGSRAGGGVDWCDHALVCYARRNHKRKRPLHDLPPHLACHRCCRAACRARVTRGASPHTPTSRCG